MQKPNILCASSASKCSVKLASLCGRPNHKRREISQLSW